MLIYSSSHPSLGIKVSLIKAIFPRIAQMQQRGSFSFQASQQSCVEPLLRGLGQGQGMEEKRGLGAQTQSSCV